MKPFKAVCITILLVSLFAPTVTAAPSYLAMCHKQWNCDATLGETVTGWLENTFNEDCPCGDKFLAQPEPKTIRVHLANSPCMRNKRCGRYEVLWGYTKASASRAVHIEGSRLNKRFDAVLERFKKRLEAASGTVSCYVSPCLECDLNGRARRALLDRVSAALPNCILVDNPYGQRCLKGYTCEGHGQAPAVSRPCIVDLDGKDGRTLDVKKWVDQYRHCDLAYYWEPWMNCIRGKFIDPRRRDCRYTSAVFSKTRGILCQYFLHPSSGTCSL